MSTLSTPAASAGLASYAGTVAETAHKAKHTLLQRIRDYLWARRRTHVDSEVTKLLQRNGGLMTDEIEREISRRLGTMAGTW